MQKVIIALLSVVAISGCDRAPAVSELVAKADHADAGVRTAAALALSSDLGQPVELRTDKIAVDGDWAWVVGLPVKPDGAPVDFATTRYAEEAREGLLDGDGVTYVLLQNRSGVWTVVDFVVGPTDVAYAEWPKDYGAPAHLMGLAD